MLRAGGFSSEREWAESGALVLRPTGEVVKVGRRGITTSRASRLGRALLMLAIIVFTLSGAGFTLLVSHINGLGSFSLLSASAGPLGAFFAPPGTCDPSAQGGTACRSGAGANPAGAPAPAAGSAPYSHSWYVVNPDAMPQIAAQDAQWLSAQSVDSTCGRDFMTVLDFAHPVRIATGNAALIDDYGMTLFRHPTPASDREVEQIAEHYLDAWVLAASNCPKLHLALGTSNFNECGGSTGACDVYAAGQAWDMVAHDVMNYVAARGYGSQVSGIWVADDLETSWDPWTTTKQFLQGVRDQEHTYTTAHAQLVNYGDANVGACSIVNGSCHAPWSASNVYDAAWGLGWAIPMPEAYNATTTALWDTVAQGQNPANPMIFAGVMTECGGSDPLPVGQCRPQGGGVTGRGACEWSPTVAAAHYQASTAGLRASTPFYATNMQWPAGTSGAKTSTAAC
ncbi:MAG TPA: hypothetical protein VF120_03935 [Ktedonobacterales bacterium]